MFLNTLHAGCMVIGYIYGQIVNMVNTLAHMWGALSIITRTCIYQILLGREISAEEQIRVRRMSVKILLFNLCQNGFGEPKGGYVSYFQTQYKGLVPTYSLPACCKSWRKISPPLGGCAFQYVNSEWPGGRPETNRGSAVGFFGRQLSIHYRILAKFGVFMGTMVPHHHVGSILNLKVH